MEEKKKTLKQQVTDVLTKAKETAGSAWSWINTNRDDILKNLPIIISLVGVYKTVKPTIGERERNRKDHEWYDPHTGKRWRLRRTPTNNEWAEISRRERCGEYQEDILRDMRLI